MRPGGGIRVGAFVSAVFVVNMAILMYDLIMTGGYISSEPEDKTLGSWKGDSFPKKSENFVT